VSEFAGKSILIVEDERALGLDYERKLRAIGFETARVESYDEAARLIASRTFHVAWIDLELGKNSSTKGSGELYEGHKLISILKQLDEGTKIVVVTAHNSPEDSRMIFMGSGADSFVAKKEIDPFDEEIKGPALEQLQGVIATCTVGDTADVTQALADCYETTSLQYATTLLVQKLNQIESVKRKLDADAINKTVASIYNHLKPIRRKKNSTAFVEWLEEEKIFNGIVWSKQFGTAVRVKIGPHSATANALVQRGAPVPFSIERAANNRSEFSA
jgi:CheY-like chemotaxis protein